MDKETKILKAIMKRFKGLTGLREALEDDTDTTIENLLDDIGGGVDYGDVEDYILKALG